ncbi:gamma-glutamyl-gamma-aminobutyrate hydrolase family protein [bacterium]|nr:gamma-glutamyl-gamma-aminobutyrate hydrolase family protein [bacterium]
MSFLRPIVGITTLLKKDEGSSLRSYVSCLQRAGASPVILAANESPDSFDILDGLLIPGGKDIDPKLFGEEQLIGLDPEDEKRVNFEIGLIRYARSRKIPILAICYGMQLLNVTLGGSMYQDIKTQIPSALNHKGPIHEVEILKDTQLAEILKEQRIRVNSTHHQAVEDLPPGLRPSARSSDGLTEAYEADGDWLLLGLQWHPEKLDEDKNTRRLFKYFVKEIKAKILVREGHP